MSNSSSGAALRPNWLHILVSLAEGDLHGSAIARDVLDQTDGKLRLWPATLYRTLDDMVAANLIVELSGKNHPDGESTRRRYYRATRKGRSELSAAVERIAALANTARRRLRNAQP
jgi:DNA-binding PadR family transcriptional regulator